MTVARTARRRRIQARNKFRHMAKIGRGNNNRPIYSMHTKDYYERKETHARDVRVRMSLKPRKK